MKTLTNHTLVYDSDCPMCDLYTKGFVKTGMLDEHGRVAYGCARVPVTFNNERARNEIALIDYNNGTVTYGLDSLVKVIDNSFPLLGKLLKLKVVRAPLNLLYSFISYNRKVIAPPKVFERKGSCTPSYKTGYRVAYIIFTWFVTSLILSNYSKLLHPYVPSTSLYREFVICGGQIIFQGIMIGIIHRTRLLHYLGNMMTVSFIGGLLLLPMLALNTVAPMIALIWFGIVVSFMLLLHWRRCKWLGISWLISLSWVCYRLIVLAMIFL